MKLQFLLPFDFLLSTLVPVLWIAVLVSQYPATEPPSNDYTHCITHSLHQPVRPPREGQRYLCGIEEEQQLWYAGCYFLGPAVFEIAVEIAEELLADADLSGGR